jgi:hypothetical protein
MNQKKTINKIFTRDYMMNITNYKIRSKKLSNNKLMNLRIYKEERIMKTLKVKRKRNSKINHKIKINSTYNKINKHN